ncbi:hypothetical protein N24_0588 [Corynebacterium suranareeae]|uniref:Uncharacterized protein n=1 Tax=Corynebacterium suranareeae TaxID=2506452 RepID=A0A160PRB9_9CORY|nr:hypothetical protein [Corynebacterium suranareeae]BAU94850.1 hypothetical protein N24_0588 [Corynebacterium suranareeae]
MGRLLLIILVIVAIVLLWKAFKPSTWRRNAGVNQGQAPRQVKGPDDDEEFLWNIEKNRFKRRRAEEAALQEEEERLKRARERYATPEEPKEGPDEKPTEDS